MRKLWVALTVLVFSLSLMFTYAQSQTTTQDIEHHDDHENNGSLQAGYVVITSSSTASNLVAFETFGMRDGLGTNQAGVLPSSLTTNAIMFVDTNGRLSKNLGVAIVNPNASPTNVTLTLRQSDGTQLGSITITVPAGQQTSRFVTEMFSNQPAVPKDLTGTLAITSTSPVSVIGLRFRGRNFSTLPVTNLSTPAPVPQIPAPASLALSTDEPDLVSKSVPLPPPSSGIGGPNAVLLPQFAAGGGWATEIVIANTGTTSMTVRVDLFKSDGTALKTTLNGTTASSFTNIVIPAGGVVVLAPRDEDGDDDF